MKPLERIISKSRIIFLGLALSSCTSTTYSTRPYTDKATRNENAYLNMQDILINLCCQDLFDSYPRCRHFKIDQGGFYCEQMSFQGEFNATRFLWKEIEKVECDYSTVNITGSYDLNYIHARSPKQCQQLADAMNTFLQNQSTLSQ